MRIEVDIEHVLRTHEREFRLDVQFASDADVTVLFGSSGAGKTLTLHAIAGLLRAQRGRVTCGSDTWFDSTQRVHVPTPRRRIGYVFQDYALFPHLTVAQNVGFATSRRRLINSRSVGAEVRTLMRRFALDEVALSYPHQLSGGQQQRVALARALAATPRLLLLDEPFAALDAPLRAHLRDELATLRSEFDVPMVLITHDPEDVCAFGGHVVRLDNGRVVTNELLPRSGDSA